MFLLPKLTRCVFNIFNRQIKEINHSDLGEITELSTQVVDGINYKIIS